MYTPKKMGKFAFIALLAASLAGPARAAENRRPAVRQPRAQAAPERPAQQAPRVVPPRQVDRAPGFIDANRDGVCDRFQQGLPPAGGRGRGMGRFAGRGPGFVDADRDGVCDRLQQGLPPAGGRGRGPGAAGRGLWFGRGPCAQAIAPVQGRGRFAGRGPGYIDENADGVCDRYQQGLPPAGGRGWGRGFGRGAGRFGGGGPGFIDQNGNGICDRFEQGLPPVGGQGRGLGRGATSPGPGAQGAVKCPLVPQPQPAPKAE